jgi:hypothetical protein
VNRPDAWDGGEDLPCAGVGNPLHDLAVQLLLMLLQQLELADALLVFKHQRLLAHEITRPDGVAREALELNQLGIGRQVPHPYAHQSGPRGGRQCASACGVGKRSR